MDKFPEIILYDSEDYKLFLKELDKNKGGGGKSLCIRCWCFLTNYQRNFPHLKENPSHTMEKGTNNSILKPNEFATEENFLRLCKENGKLDGENIIRPLEYEIRKEKKANDASMSEKKVKFFILIFKNSITSGYIHFTN